MPQRSTDRQSVATREPCSKCSARKHGVCAYCGPDVLAQLEGLRSYRTYAPGQEILAAGEESGFVATVIEGIVSLSQTMADGRRQTVGMMFPPDFIGRPMRPIAPYDAVALTQVRLCILVRQQFERILRGSPALERRLLELTLDELDVAHEWMLLLGRKTAGERVASFLLLFARRAAMAEGTIPADGLNFDLPLSREAMAEYLGTTIETVSRQLTWFQEVGLIDLVEARRIRVRDYRALIEIAADDCDGGLIT